MEALDVDFSARDTRTTPMIEISVIFFDIGDTLATVNPDVTDRLELLPLPGAAEALRRLSTVGLRLGVISNTGAETSQTMRRALQGAGLYALPRAQAAHLQLRGWVDEELARDLPTGVRARRYSGQAREMSVCRGRRNREGICRKRGSPGRRDPCQGGGSRHRSSEALSFQHPTQCLGGLRIEGPTWQAPQVNAMRSATGRSRNYEKNSRNRSTTACGASSAR